MESTRKGGVVKRRNYKREGKKGAINIVLKSGWIESSSNGGVSFKRNVKVETQKLKVSLSLSPQS